ncbi:MAG: PepSY domain-containing protein [Porticoccaceae bacterium]|jgi:uncharacterized membrane protein YkoI|nr:PepSY domain-containing protein [Porticoccaceae bacterium]
MVKAKTPALLLGLLCAGASAGDLSHNEALALRRSGELMPFEAIVTALFDRYPEARILEVELEAEGETYVYELEILTTANQVRELEIDARSGRILEDEIED